MPIYEYQCNACGHTLEALQKFSDEPLTVCPKCQQTTLIKLISAAGFQLKGSGWYATDYRDKGKAEVKKEDNSGSSSSGTDAPKDTKSSDSNSNNSSNNSAVG